MSASGPAEDVPGAGPRAVVRRLAAARARRGDAGGPTSYERDFATGAEGEERFGRELDAEAARWGGFGVLHSLTSPDAPGDIDHLVVGPAGVTVIDSKTWAGVASVRRGALRMGRYNKSRELEGVRRQTERVRRALADAGYGLVPVGGALCMVNANPGISTARLAWVGDVAIGVPKTVIDHAVRAGPMSVAVMHTVHHALSGAFAVAGGSVEPSHPVPRPQPTAPPRPVTARPRRHRRAVIAFRAIFALALIAAAVNAASAIVKETSDLLGPMSRAELSEHMGSYRDLAFQRAGGRVSGPRVLSRPADFRLVYRRGERCRIVVTVQRTARWAGPRQPEVRLVGCAPAK